MKKFQTNLALASATSAILMLSGVTAVSAGDLEVAAQQPSVISDIGAETDGMYIVRLADAPIATYEGGVDGLAPTSPKANGKTRLDTKSKAVKDYEKYLRQQQKEVLGHAGKALGRAVSSEFQYQHAFNGFAVELTVDEAKAMRTLEGVASVQRERMEQPLTDVGPVWIGAPGIWFNGKDSSQGEGVVIAVLDTGINHDHPSFADIGGDGYDHINPLGSGNYVPGSYCDTTDPSFCNDKLIGAWSFVPGDVNFPSPQDSDGHGSHTASIAAGNVVNGAELVAPTTSALFDISGVARHANIIAYDVCVVSCPGSALLAAINQVVIDSGNLPNGIHAVNYSISGGGDPYNDAVELGFLAATAAGIYVSASAGNSGPGASTVAHLGPWTGTTASSTHNRTIVNSLIDINSGGGGLADITGKGFTAGYGPAPIINSADLEGAFPGSTLCGLGGLGSFIPPWPPGTFNGEIVACTRGTFGRVEKGANVLAAGAGGYVLMDNGGGLVGDPHVLPGVHISQADGAVLSGWLAANAGNNPMAVIEGYTFDYDAANGDVMAGTSSRGPNLVVDVIKPDVTAPGVDIMGAEADGQGLSFPEYQIISGTSMSSPHHAGSAALLAAVKPNWSPHQIKSALMLTANTDFTVKEDGVTPTDPFDLGAGRLELGAAKNPGLTMDESTANFLAADPDAGGDPSSLNLASMKDSACIGTCSWTRTVSNDENNTAHWNVTASGNGFDAVAEVSPEAASGDYNLKLMKGQEGTITVTANTALSPDGWHFGTVDLDRNKEDGPDLSMPIAVKAAKASNPGLFTKTVDAATAGPGDTLTYEINVINGPLTGPITVTDEVPDGVTYVTSSATESVVNGSTSTPWAYNAGTNTLTWVGMLDPGGLNVAPSAAPFGYLPLSVLGVPPFALPGNCDDGGFILNVPPYTFDGATHTNMIWSVNGTMEAGTASGLAASAGNTNMPSASPPNNLVAPNWTDLNLCTGGAWRVAVLNFVFPSQFTVYDWENVPLFGDLSRRYSFQIWVENNVSGAPAIWFTYGNVDAPLPNLTVGAENSDATNGFPYYFNGAGTPPAPGTDLEVTTGIGGTATLGFQVTTDGCGTVVNTAELENGGDTEKAIAVTTCP
jgi:uncharacterized repeat protein (TIGR01451 family)